MQALSCSIIIPTRNCLNYLPTTLASIEVQGRDDVEIIVADDGSTDGTAEWLAGRPSAPIKLTCLDTGGIGPAAARNKAVEAAQGDILAFLDADDQWLPGKLGPQLEFHRQHPTVGLSFTDYMHVTPDGRTHGSCFEYWNRDWVQASDLGYFELKHAESRLLSANVVGTSTVMVSRRVFDVVDGFSVASRFAEDWDLWLRMAAVTGVGCSRAVTMSYLVRPGSETANRDGRIAAMRAVVARYQNRSEPAIIQAVRAAVGCIDVAVAEAARARGQHVAAATSHLKAFSATPNWRTGKAIAADIVAASRNVFGRADVIQSASGANASRPDCKP
jgi:glycosyltransferase involved in cell wall biosynthesis